MPPKARIAKEKKQAVDDKTFGLKNKNKSSKVSKYVAMVESQVAASGNRKEKMFEDQRAELARKKREEAEKKAEMAALFKPIVIQPKVPFGVDPKTMLCAFFKAGICQKGTKCKFAHDLDVERKAVKLDVYTDPRDQETMEDWDQQKLEAAVAEKHDSNNINKPTDIVCKFFLDAIEDRKYGYFWTCPNGSLCKYRHALPPGFILKKKETEEERKTREADEKANAITIEDFLETERHKLGPNTTPVTAESFAKWKSERKTREGKLKADEALKKAEEVKKMKAGMKTGMVLSGKDLFDFNPDWQDADDTTAMETYERQPEEEQEDKENTNQVNEELFASENLAGLDLDDDDEIENEMDDEQ